MKKSGLCLVFLLAIVFHLSALDLNFSFLKSTPKPKLQVTSDVVVENELTTKSKVKSIKTDGSETGTEPVVQDKILIYEFDKLTCIDLQPVITIPAIKIVPSSRSGAVLDTQIFSSCGGGLSLQYKKFYMSKNDRIIYKDYQTTQKIYISRISEKNRAVNKAATIDELEAQLVELQEVKEEYEKFASDNENLAEDFTGTWYALSSVSLVVLIAGDTASEQALDLSTAVTLGAFNNLLMIGIGYDFGTTEEAKKIFGVLSIGINLAN